MLKKNKLSLFLLAVVMMLTIYYVNMPSSEPSNEVVDTNPIVQRYALFAEARLEVLTNRNSAISELEAVLASADLSLTQKETAYKELTAWMSLTEKEVLAETTVTTIGFIDCLVIASLDNNEVNCSVLTEEFTLQNYIEVATALQTTFAKKIHVVVTVVHPTEEQKGL